MPPPTAKVFQLLNVKPDLVNAFEVNAVGVFVT